MKLREYSDVHLDHYAWAFQQTRIVDPSKPIATEPDFWYPPELSDDKETTLILSGDLWVGTAFIEWMGISWISKVAPRFKKVLIVLGNHDYWPTNNALTILKGAEKCNKLLKDMGIWNVQVLDCDTYQDGDYLFVGATLWTDMNKMDPLTMHSLDSLMAYDGKIAYATGPNGYWERFTPEKWVSTHRRHKKYIETVAQNNKDKKIVVITHHIPLQGLGEPMYVGQMSNGYYMSDLSDLILDNENIIMWFYGHTHYQKETIFPPYAEPGDGCRLINNCVGYQGQHFEQLGLVKHEVIEI